MLVMTRSMNSLSLQSTEGFVLILPKDTGSDVGISFAVMKAVSQETCGLQSNCYRRPPWEDTPILKHTQKHSYICTGRNKTTMDEPQQRACRGKSSVSCPPKGEPLNFGQELCYFWGEGFLRFSAEWRTEDLNDPDWFMMVSRETLQITLK